MRQQAERQGLKVGDQFTIDVSDLCLGAQRNEMVSEDIVTQRPAIAVRHDRKLMTAECL